MRYDVIIGGIVAVRFDQAVDALEYLCLAYGKEPGIEFDFLDNEVGLPFDRKSVIEWCRQHIAESH